MGSLNIRIHGESMKRTAALMGLCMALSGVGPTVYADVIGVFTVVEGQVTVLRGQHYYAAAEGVEVEDRDLVESQADSTTQIEMVDGSTLRLGADTRLLLSDYDIDDDKSVVAASIDLLSGWLRFAVAKLKKNARYELNTPTLIIGVRGTEGVIEAGNEQAGILLEEGLVDVSTQGEEAALFPPVQVRAGQFVQRRQGTNFRRFRQAPAAFRARLPARLQRRLQRRIHQLRRRGVPARVIRRATQSDLHRYLRQHAPMRQKLDRRLLRPRGQSKLRKSNGVAKEKGAVLRRK